MRLEWLRYFTEIAATGSLNKAAENLYISQPALTKNIRVLEKEVGATLLHRKKTGVYLTEQGELFWAFAQEVLGIYQDYLVKKSTLQDNQQKYEGTLELVISPSLWQTYYQDILLKLRQTFPMVKFYCTEAGVEDATRLLIDDMHRIGVIICIWQHMAPYWKKIGLASWEIGQSAVIGCVSRHSSYASKPFIDKATIATESLISMELTPNAFLRTADETSGIRTTNLEIIKQILLSETDACVLSAQLVAERKLISPDIMALPVAPPMTASICLVYNQRALEQAIYPSTFLQNLAEIIRQCIQPVSQ